MNKDDNSMETVKTGLQFSSEVLLPGGSNLIKGDLVQGGLHAVLGLAAGAIFGLPGLLLIKANSFTKAKTGQHLYEHIGLTNTEDNRTDRPGGGRAKS